MTTRNRRATALTLACLCAALLTACTQKSPEAGRPNTAPPPTRTTMTEPTAAPSNSSAPPTAAPERPGNADGLTLAAGEAFVRYYSDLMNYAADTGDAAPMLAVSDAGCEHCKLYAKFAKESNHANGLLTGDYREKVKEITQLTRAENGHLGGFAVITVGQFISRQSPSASPFNSKPRTYTREVALSPQDGRWVMFELRQQEQ